MISTHDVSSQIVLGAVGGKHIVMQTMHGARSQHHNITTIQGHPQHHMNTNTVSPTLMLAANGRVSAGRVLRDSTLGTAMCGDSDTNILNVPHPRPLSGRTYPMPYVDASRV